jgi:hypothetical protein
MQDTVIQENASPDGVNIKGLDTQEKPLPAVSSTKSMLVGSTWHFVNESNGQGISTKGPNTITSATQMQDLKIGGNISFLPLPIMNNITRFSGKITFYWYEIQIKTANGIDPTYTSNPSWSTDGHTLTLDGITPFIHQRDGSSQFPFIFLTFTKISPNLIELQDRHGDTIELSK